MTLQPQSCFLRFLGMVIALGCPAAAAPPSAQFINSAGLVMLRMAPGSFVMGERNLVPDDLGGPSYSPHGDWDEQPSHRVAITREFYISQTPVTQKAFAQFKSETTGVDFFAPYVAGVSWTDAMAFCDWLGRREGRTYRLPTEAEWEYVARAGTTSLFWSGRSPPPVHRANPWGLIDICSGFPEWCLDWHGPYASGDEVDPLGPDQGTARVVRGGGIEMRELVEVDRGRRPLGFSPTRWRAPGAYFARAANRASMLPAAHSKPGVLDHYIGFRVVAADLPPSHYRFVPRPFPLEAVLQTTNARRGPSPAIPYFRSRPILPIPPENDQGGSSAAVGIAPGVLGHIHSGGIAVMPNGDVLQISFSASTPHTEYETNTTMIVSRLRRGAMQWDMPELFYDIADMNDQSVLLWNDHDRIWFLGGGRYHGDVRFKFATSSDSGQSWSRLTEANVTRQVAFVEAQPINSMFRMGKDMAIYFGADAKGKSSMLWVSSDGGQSWQDTGGRTAGRHTTFVALNDGRILGMGGKLTDIDGFMPKVYSSDRGRTWSKPERTPFPALGPNQRPVILRLRSGRLFFAADYQQIAASRQPPAAITERGAFVALSDDEGATWHVKKLGLALPHEAVDIPKITAEWGEGGDHRNGTLGYCAAAQGENGVIHLLTSMNHPSQHFEMNEAWILSPKLGEQNISLEGPNAGPVEVHEERTQDGQVSAVWHGRSANNGDFVLDGMETIFYADGSKHYEVNFVFGEKRGTETLWRPDGSIEWQWNHRADGRSTWVQFFENGRKRSESTWHGFRADGPATVWASDGSELSRTLFRRGTAE